MPERENNKPPQPRAFEFTINEQLYSRVNHARLLSILTDEQTQLHHIELSVNTYGEFLFVTISRPEKEKRKYITFWGMGLHEYRERWLTNEWHWYSTSIPNSETEDKDIPSQEEALELIEKRRQEVLVYAEEQQQSQRGQLFELLADLTDDDGAWAEMQDLGDLFDDLSDHIPFD